MTMRDADETSVVRGVELGAQKDAGRDDVWRTNEVISHM